MAKRWRGDDRHELPAQQVEPYRLWFEFLKLAKTDPTITVDLTVYRSWGNIDGQDFSDWWSSHWRSLFAVDLGVSVIDDPRSFLRASDRELLLRVPLYQSPTKSLAQIRKLLEAHGASDRLADMATGQFKLDVGTDKAGKSIDPSQRFLRNLPKVRLLMHLYRFWLQFPEHDERRRLERTAQAFAKWGNDWNEKVRTKGWNRPKVEVPAAVNDYVAFLARRGNRKRISLHLENDGANDDNRRQIARYLRKARKVAANVAFGVFPGAY